MKKKGVLFGALVFALALGMFSCSNLIEDLRGHPVTPEPETPATYTVTIAGITNGTVTADRTSARKDETVTLTVAANSGYDLEDVSVRDADNNAISTTEVTAGTTYTFVMPESNVTVSATFVQEMLAMVDVITSATTITGQDPSFVDSGASNNYKGAFRTGRNVTLSPYRMSKYEVTQGVYAQYMAGESLGGKNLASEPSYCMETGTYPLVSGDTQNLRPVEGVTWYDAVYFCNALTEKTLGADKKVYIISGITVNSEGHITNATVSMDMTKTGYRLPTEAEWEFAARGGDQTKPDWNYLFSGHATADGVSYSNSKNSGMDSVGWYVYNTQNG